MADVIDKYAFSLFLDGKGFTNGANLALTSLNGLTKGFSAAAITLAGIDLFGNMLGAYHNLSKDIGRLSEVTGEDIKTLEAWRITVRDTGGDVNAFNGTVKALNDDMGNFDKYGESKTLGVFARLGISLRKGNGELKQGTELLTEFGNVVNNMDVRSAKAFAQQLGIDDSTFIALRRHGSSIKSIVNQNKQFAVVKKDDVKLMQEMDALTSQFKQLWAAISFTIMREVLPILRDNVMPVIEDMVEFIIAHKEDFKAFFAGAWDYGVRLFENIGPLFQTFLKDVDDLVEKLGGTEAILQTIKNVFETILLTVKELVKWIGFFWERAKEGADIAGGFIGKAVGWLTRDKSIDDYNAQNAAAQAKFMKERPDLAAQMQTTNNNSITVGDIIISTQATTPDGIGAAVNSSIKNLPLDYSVGGA